VKIELRGPRTAAVPCRTARLWEAQVEEVPTLGGNPGNRATHALPEGRKAKGRKRPLKKWQLQSSRNDKMTVLVHEASQNGRFLSLESFLQ